MRPDPVAARLHRRRPGSSASRSGCSVSGWRVVRWRRSRSARPERCMTSSRSSCCSRPSSWPPTRARPWRTRCRAPSMPSAPTRAGPSDMPMCATPSGDLVPTAIWHIDAADSVRGLSPRDRADDDSPTGIGLPGRVLATGEAGMDHRRDRRPELPEKAPRGPRRLRVPDPRGWRAEGGAGVLHRGGCRARPRRCSR